MTETSPRYGVPVGPVTRTLMDQVAAAPRSGRGWAGPHVPVKRTFLLDAAGLDDTDLTDEARYALSVLATESTVETVAGVGALIAIACEKAARR